MRPENMQIKIHPISKQKKWANYTRFFWFNSIIIYLVQIVYNFLLFLRFSHAISSMTKSKN